VNDNFKTESILKISNIHTHMQPFYGSLDFVRDNPGEPVPEEALKKKNYLSCQ